MFAQIYKWTIALTFAAVSGQRHVSATSRLEATQRIGVDARGQSISTMSGSFHRKLQETMTTTTTTTTSSTPTGTTCADVQAEYNAQGCCGADNQEFNFTSLTQCNSTYALAAHSHRAPAFSPHAPMQILAVGSVDTHGPCTMCSP
jgi:hypothetical protein